jgi:hypothetical protein
LRSCKTQKRNKTRKRKTALLTCCAKSKESDGRRPSPLVGHSTPYFTQSHILSRQFGEAICLATVWDFPLLRDIYGGRGQ